MTLVVALAGFGVGLWLMVEGAEKFTDALLGVAITLALTPLVLGYVFSGIDLENLAVGSAAAVGGRPGVSLGTIVGSALFMLSFAVGATAVVVPLTTAIPRRLLVLTLLSPLPLMLLGLDDELSRLDGGLLLALAAVLITYVVATARRDPLFTARHREDDPGAGTRRGLWSSIGLGVGALVVISVGAEVFNWSVGRLLEGVDLDETAFGMVIVAAAVSFEEVPRMVVPARRGHASISVGNILGTVMFFFLFNAGLIALISPLALSGDVLAVHWPALMAVLALTTAFLARGRIGRREGALLLAAYGGYIGLAAWRGITLPL